MARPVSSASSPSRPPRKGRSLRGILRRLKEDAQAARATVQGVFLVLCLWIGVEFVLFMRWADSGGLGACAPHPPGAEGFLPIGALLGLKHWILTGRIHPYHPAGLFIFLAILGVSLLLRKAFCSWMCPIGTLSEGLWKLGRRMSGRNVAPPRWMDYPLRSLKYLLLGFFLWAVWNMDGAAVRAFLDSPFNAVADVRMYRFFTRMSGSALGVILVLGGLSLAVQDVWCRYLCPYGALLGLLGMLSPLRVVRAKAGCIDCGRCTRACPSRIEVHAASAVRTDDCTACYCCVEACPVKGTLRMAAPGGRAVPGWVFGLLVAGLFAAVTGWAMLTDCWRTSLGPADYLQAIPEAAGTEARR